MIRVDISLLCQLEEESKGLHRVASELGEARLQQIADRMTHLLALAAGRVTQCDLAAAAMPQDVQAKIPDPRERTED